jgi:hypothetical protein
MVGIPQLRDAVHPIRRALATATRLRSRPKILDLLFYEMAFTGTENHLRDEAPSFAVCSCQQQLS